MWVGWHGICISFSTFMFIKQMWFVDFVFVFTVASCQTCHIWPKPNAVDICLHIGIMSNMPLLAIDVWLAIVFVWMSCETHQTFCQSGHVIDACLHIGIMSDSVNQSRHTSVRKIIMVHYYFVSLEYNNINAVFVHVILLY